jgi:ribosome biogenesis GTPase
MSLSGRVIEEQKNYFIVDTVNGQLRATTRGVLKKDNKRICVGDFVECEIINSDTLEAQILSIHDRTGFLKRPPIANLSQVICVCTVKEPPLNLEAVDRFLFCAAAFGLSPVMVFNKFDLITPVETPELDKISGEYRRIGFRVINTSAVTGLGITELTNLCRDKISAFTGLSGVGKSALMNRIFPEKEFRVGLVSGAKGRGTHTTTTVSLIPLPQGGYIADTPGLAFVDLPQADENTVASHFPELEKLSGKCRFNNCIHRNEPGCTVKEMVAAGEIAAWRVEHYLKIYDEMKTLSRRY